MQQKNNDNIKFLQDNGITTLSFSQSGAYCAIGTKKDYKILVFQVKTLNDINTWNLLQQMKDHHQTVAAIDWSIDQKIVTVSHDRSVFVWKKNGNKWDKMLVNIDVKLSVLACKWAPSSRKFALGSCPSTLTLCYFSPEANCWTATVKETLFKAPITTLDFHSSSNIIAVGTVDNVVSLVTCSFKKSSDQMVIKAKIQEYPYSGPFQKIDSLWEVLYTIDTFSNWINHVSFQNNGKKLLVITHSSHIKLFDVVQGQKTLCNQQDIVHKGLPFMNGFISQKSQLIMAGFDKKVACYKKNDKYKFDKYLTNNERSNVVKKKGLVEGHIKGIQKRQSYFGQGPKLEQHRNTAKVTKTRNTIVSYDINGVIHFWE